MPRLAALDLCEAMLSSPSKAGDNPSPSGFLRSSSAILRRHPAEP
jgi:hypothetical protein